MTKPMIFSILFGDFTIKGSGDMCGSTNKTVDAKNPKKDIIEDV
jgi:hypothetical protein